MATPLLEFEHVSKSYIRGSRREVVLVDASFEMYPRDLVAVWGERRSGRSTLMALAAGIEVPDAGCVRFLGHDLSDPNSDICFSGGIGFCRTLFRPSEGNSVLALLMLVQLARGATRAQARSRAHVALSRVGAEDCVERRPHDLDADEIVRVAIARALTSQPQLLIIDDPCKGIDAPERDQIFDLLRSLADEGLGVFTTGSIPGVVNRALSLGQGELRGNLVPKLASVSQLPLVSRKQANA